MPGHSAATSGLVGDLPFDRNLDADALAELLEKIESSLLIAMAVSEGLRMSTRKMGAEIERLNSARGQVSQLMDALEGIMGDAVDMVHAADEDAEPNDRPEPDCV